MRFLLYDPLCAVILPLMSMHAFKIFKSKIKGLEKWEKMDS